MNVTKSLNYPLKIKLPTGEEIALVDLQKEPLYSTCYILSGATDRDIYLFNYGRGDKVSVSNNIPAAVAPDADETHTNLAEGGEMDPREAMIVYAIQFEVFQTAADANPNPTTIQDPGGALRSGIPRAGLLGPLTQYMIAFIDVSQKHFQKAGFGWFSTGFGVKVFSDGATVPATFANLGHHERDAVAKIDPPVTLAATEKFNLTLRKPGTAPLTFYDDNGAADTQAVAQIRGYLHGLHKRPVQ